MPWVWLQNIFGATVRPMSRYWSTLKIVLWFDQVYLCKMFTVQKNKDSITPLTISKNNKSRYFHERASGHSLDISKFALEKTSNTGLPQLFHLLYQNTIFWLSYLFYRHCSVYLFPRFSLYFPFNPFTFFPFCLLSFPFPFVYFRNLKVFVLNWRRM